MPKDFVGKWIANTSVFFTPSDPVKATVEEFQIVELEITKIADQDFKCIFTQIYPPSTSSVINSNKFVCVATQTTENRFLIQGASSGGLNTFYFKNDLEEHNESCCKEEVLYTTFSTSIPDGLLSGVQRYSRIN